MTRRFPSILTASLLLCLSVSAHAQLTPGGPDQLDTPIDAGTKSAAVESLIVKMQQYYVFPEKANELAKVLRKRLAAKEYDRIGSSKEFADSLRAHMQAVTHDLHTRVHYSADPIAARPGGGVPSAEELAKELEFERVRNFGFDKLERLAGNVGYMELRNFSSFSEAMPTAIAAMNFLANTDAVIIDLRRNPGGAPALIQLLLAWFLEPGQTLHLTDFYVREGNRTVQYYTAPYVPGPSLHGRPLYVLIGPATGSAAEEFAYDVQTHGLGKVVGATSAGAANPGDFFPLSRHLAAFIATGRSINPKTKTNWEGVGVKPDMAVAAGEALREAHVAAIQKLMEGAKDEAKRMNLGRALEVARQTPAAGVPGPVPTRR